MVTDFRSLPQRPLETFCFMSIHEAGACEQRPPVPQKFS
jgi:hypothetical protein